MTNGIFVSSASPDAVIVRRMLGRLRDLGLDPPPGVDLPRIWHYEEDMKAGDQIFANVDAAIDASTIAVLCLSDAALSRPWIGGEVALVRKALGEKRLQNVIPVKVGKLDDKSLDPVRDFLVGPDQFIADVSGGAETELVNLAAQIHAELGLNAPKMLALGVLAMTSKQAAELVEEWRKLDAAGKPTPVADVCKAVGVVPPELFELILSRYGARPEDMMPFRGESLRDIIHAELNQANRQRVEMQCVPLFPRWLHGELMGDDQQLADNARTIWADNDSLLIVDSISVYHKDIVEQLLLWPEPRKDPSRSAIVCLPPYTRRTVALEESFRLAFRGNRRAVKLAEWFDQWFDRWHNRERMFAFDTATSVSLGSWLERRFAIVPGEYKPQGRKREAMPASTYKGRPTQQFSEPG